MRSSQLVFVLSLTTAIGIVGSAYAQTAPNYPSKPSIELNLDVLHGVSGGAPVHTQPAEPTGVQPAAPATTTFTPTEPPAPGKPRMVWVKGPEGQIVEPKPEPKPKKKKINKPAPVVEPTPEPIAEAPSEPTPEAPAPEAPAKKKTKKEIAQEKAAEAAAKQQAEKAAPVNDVEVEALTPTPEAADVAAPTAPAENVPAIKVEEKKPEAEQAIPAPTTTPPPAPAAAIPTPPPAAPAVAAAPAIAAPAPATPPALLDKIPAPPAAAKAPTPPTPPPAAVVPAPTPAEATPTPPAAVSTPPAPPPAAETPTPAPADPAIPAKPAKPVAEAPAATPVAPIATPPAPPPAPPAAPVAAEAPALPKPTIEKPATPPATADAADAAGKKQADLSITFKTTETALPLTMKAPLDELVGKLKANDSLRVNLLSYASSPADQASTARRVSLSRALSVRGYLIDQGVGNLRINVQAEGDKNPGGEPDRVDVFITN